MNTSPLSPAPIVRCSTVVSRDDSFSLDVACDGSSVRATIVDSRPEVVAVFSDCTPAEQVDLAGQSWSVGSRSILRAQRLAEESRLADIGRTLCDDLEEKLEGQAKLQQQRFEAALTSYFDPKDGRVFSRMENFLANGGELERTMAKFLGPENGDLAKTFARVLGENSPLLKRLSPTDSEGVVSLIESKLKLALAENGSAVTKALDPLTQGGAAARFMEALKKELQRTENDRSKQLATLTKALDSNDPTSAISRLLRDADKAQKAMMKAVNADDPSSPLAIVRASLTRQLETHSKEQRAELVKLVERGEKHHIEVLDRITRIEERKRAEASSAAGGATFEDALVATVQDLVGGAAVTVEATGNTVGLTPHCKVGDLVLQFTEESKYAGGALVIEAKHDASYTVPRALKELETARQNRGAAAGLFVMARSHAPAGFPRFARYGQDVLILWDHERDDLDPYLDAALSLGLALVPNALTSRDAGDIEALKAIEGRVMGEIDRLESIRKYAARVRADAAKIGKEAGPASKKLNILLRDTKKTLRALDVKLVDFAEQRANPIMLPEPDADAAE